MSMANALEALGAAISAEVCQEVQAVREELEQERQLRQLLEQQVLKLQQHVYPSVEVDRLLEELSAKVHVTSLDAAEAAAKDWAMKLQLAEQGLQASFEAFRSSAEPHFADAAKRAASAADSPSPALLTVEIDRKIGTAIVDLDQRFEAAKAAQAEACREEIRKVMEEAEAGSHTREAQFLDLQKACQADVESLRTAMSAKQESSISLMVQLEALQTGLEQKIGMVQLDLDQLRQELGECGGYPQVSKV
eukprot:TRINITY_DN50587_c0_g1_i1.p1 TRINITY_DN50587_c0_g1~~TRINITY_DN50587_c0_g1_i1.p1  ORF type:complete len:258 (-),score=90.18 TRINITY_DN50587_c0_g1_i1:43-789(-)